MKCPMKMANPNRKGCSCEREGCAWWVVGMKPVSGKVGGYGACAVVMAGAPVSTYNGDYVADRFDVLHDRDSTTKDLERIYEEAARFGKK